MNADQNHCHSWRDDAARNFAALSHPARIAILLHLSEHACCCKDVVQRLDLAQSTVSQHLQVLVKAGLVRFSTDRHRSTYKVDPAALRALADAAASLAKSCCREESST